MKTTKAVEGKILSFTLDRLIPIEEKARHTPSHRRRRKVRGFANKSTLDRGNDRVLPEAFKDSKNSYMQNPVVFMNHNWDVPIGKTLQFDILDEGPFVEIELGEGFEEADKAWKLIEQDLIKGLSIGFRVKDEDYDSKTGIRTVKNLDLYEISIVTIPMNADAMFEVDSQGGVKSILVKTEDNLMSYKEYIGENLNTPDKEEEDEDKLSIIEFTIDNAKILSRKGVKHITATEDDGSDLNISFKKGDKFVDLNEDKETLDDVKEDIPDNNIRPTLEWQETECSFCEKKTTAITCAVSAMGKEFCICMECLAKSNEVWHSHWEGKNSQIDELHSTVDKQDKELEFLKNENSKYKKYFKGEIAALVKDATEILIQDTEEVSTES
jgi:HK97 family phage prohead protease